MEEINQKVAELLEAVQRTQIYRDYREQEELIKQNPELEARLKRFRGDNFRLQNQAIHMVNGQLYSEGGSQEYVSQLYQESRELRSYQECNAYLDAELALCKLLQKIARRICDGIEIDIPDVRPR